MTELLPLTRAYRLAAEAHVGQFRKGPAGIPYINHPCAVAEMTAEAGGDEVAVLAAILHDVVEDSEVTLAGIEAAFGPEVAGVVDELTSPAEWDELPLAEKKAKQTAHIRTASDRAKLVKLADQCSNVQDLLGAGDDWPPARLATYLAGASDIATECAGLAPGLDAEFARAAARLSARLEAGA